MRWLIRPYLAHIARGGISRVARSQIAVAGRYPKGQRVADCEYDYWGEGERVMPGHTLGEPFKASDSPVILWLHGGAFIFPAMPDGHLPFVNRLCRSLSASAFLPDYRLAPANPFPAALNDCESAYRLLLDAGVSPDRIVLGGESAGGNLVVALLYRIRKQGLPMPVCAIPVSPTLDMGRLNGAPPRFLNVKKDAMLSTGVLFRIRDWYVGESDSANPEVSPLMGECSGLPPLLITASTAELLCDDSVLFARKASKAGVKTELALWPLMPHAFPLLERWIPEAKRAREDITTFIQEQLGAEKTD
jgi:acetyl esterase/lipase